MQHFADGIYVSGQPEAVEPIGGCLELFIGLPFLQVEIIEKCAPGLPLLLRSRIGLHVFIKAVQVLVDVFFHGICFFVRIRISLHVSIVVFPDVFVGNFRRGLPGGRLRASHGNRAEQAYAQQQADHVFPTAHVFTLFPWQPARRGLCRVGAFRFCRI